MKISEMFARLEKKPAFMPYVCCGDPSADFTVRLVETLVANGADAIELGIPFSDPIADGKTIQMASARALTNGMTPKKAFGIVRRMREIGIGVPIIVMTYYNVAYALGVEHFVKSIKEAGADGLIVPDVPLEESDSLHAACGRERIDLAYLIAPNCSDERIRKIAEKSKGFVYAVSVIGITGARENIAAGALELIKRTKKITNVPLVAGFGISKPEHVKELAGVGADGVIVGSEIINIYSRHMRGNGPAGDGFDESSALREIAEFTRGMKKY